MIVPHEGSPEDGARRPGAVEHTRFRPLTEDERDTLVAVLEMCGPGRDLLAQVPSTLVSRDDPITSADLRVIGAVPVEGLTSRLFPVDPDVLDVVEDDGREVGGIII